MPFEDSPRLRNVFARYGETLAAAARERHDLEEPGPIGFFLRFAEADPTRNHAATQWLVLTYIANGFHFEDLGKARETLVAFARHRARLEAPERDLGRYRTLADLWKAVKPFVEAENPPPASGREARRLDRERARSESVILHEGEDGFTVAVPMTEFAAKWWGRGTRWCTSSDEGNVFSRFHWTAPLIVILMPGGEKLQLHTERNAFQFMDEDDAAVKRSFVKKHWDHLAPVFLWAVQQTNRVLKFFPPEYRDKAVCMHAAKKEWHGLRDIPEGIWDRDLAMTAIRHNGMALGHVPKRLIDREMCLKAVRQWGRALEAVPTEFRDREICLEAVRNAGDALMDVPIDLRDRAMCLDAIRQSGTALEFVPENLKDREVCLTAIGQNGLCLGHVPAKLLDPDVCIDAVRQNGNALLMVPEGFLDRSLCLEALKTALDTDILRKLPKSLFDREFYRSAVKLNGKSIRFVPEGQLSYDMCVEAVRQFGEMLFFVPMRMRNLAMCLEAVMSNGYALNYVPKALRTDEIRRIAAHSRSVALESVRMEDRNMLVFDDDDSEGPVRKSWDESILDNLKDMIAKHVGSAIEPEAPYCP